MDLKKLLYFTAVAECGSFTKAAEMLRIAQPALSRQVGILENEFGVKLLLRMGRRVQLTEAGEVLLKHAYHINNSFEHAREEMQNTAHSSRGHVVLGAPPSLGSVIVPRLFERLRRDFKGISLKVREGTTSFLKRSILEAEIDLAVVGEDVDDRRITDHVLAREEIVAIGRIELLEKVKTGSVESWNEIPLFTTWQVRLLIAKLIMGRCNHMPEPFEFDAIHAVKALALEGRGIALGPLALFSVDIAKGDVSVARIRGADLWRPLVMAASSVRAHTRALETVISTLTEEISKLDKAGSFLLKHEVPTLTLPNRCENCIESDQLSHQ